MRYQYLDRNGIGIAILAQYWYHTGMDGIFANPVLFIKWQKKSN
jgi:hypothetical protein